MNFRLLDHEGALRRVEVDFARASALGQQVVDVRHEAIRKVEGGWAQSLTPAGESSPAVTPLGDTRLSPFLVLKVNGVRIAARGGSWGTDDFMKRSSREHLEPYFRLHRDAHVNIIRNWVGQNIEETFYDLGRRIRPADRQRLLGLDAGRAGKSRRTCRCSSPTPPT